MILKYSVDIKKNLHYIIFKNLNEISSWGLSKNDLKVFAAFYNKDFELLKSISVYRDRMVVLFSKDVKDILIKDINISYNTFNNSLSKLRRKGLIEGTDLHEQWLFDLDKLEFNLIIKLEHEPQITKIITEA